MNSRGLTVRRITLSILLFLVFDYVAGIYHFAQVPHLWIEKSLRFEDGALHFLQRNSERCLGFRNHKDYYRNGSPASSECPFLLNFEKPEDDAIGWIVGSVLIRPGMVCSSTEYLFGNEQLSLLHYAPKKSPPENIV